MNALRAVLPRAGVWQRHVSSTAHLRPQFRSDRVGLVVFDKDGTLMHCNKCYGPWLEQLVGRLQDQGSLRDPAACYRALSYDVASKTFELGSPVVHAGNDDVIAAVAAEALRQGAVDDVETFKDRTAPLWDFDVSPFLSEETLEMCTGAREPTHELFRAFAQSGIGTAVCTMDHRASTEAQLTLAGLGDFLHYATDVACGDDLGVPVKPNPGGILKLVDGATNQTAGAARPPERVFFAEVSAERTVMVGDSFNDVLAGIRAGCRSLVFVFGDRPEQIADLGAFLSTLKSGGSFADEPAVASRDCVIVPFEDLGNDAPFRGSEVAVYVMPTIEHMLQTS